MFSFALRSQLPTFQFLRLEVSRPSSVNAPMARPLISQALDKLQTPQKELELRRSINHGRLPGHSPNRQRSLERYFIARRNLSWRIALPASVQQRFGYFRESKSQARRHDDAIDPGNVLMPGE